MSLSVTNDFTSSGVLNTKSMTFSNNNDDSKSRLLQKSFFGVGSAYTQGNVVRSFYDINNGPRLFYTPSQQDVNAMISKYSNLFNQFQVLNEFPWLYYFQSGEYEQVVTESRNRPIYNIIGKGLGVVELYNVGNSLQGDYIESKPLWMEHYYNFNIQGRIPLQPKLKNISNHNYPFSGKLYSGTLVQHYFSTDKTIQIIPYQAGRGVPQWDPYEDYYSGAPWGVPMLPNGVVLEPCLSYGVSPGNNDFCLGVCLDSHGKNKLYQTHNGNYAPQTIPTDTKWAPWSEEYAYKSSEPAPVLTKGKTALRIGACSNIGMQCYYEPDVEDGDDPRGNDKYVPIQCIPLFQGERVKLGSEVYATHMGHVITWNRCGVSPYPVGSQVNVTGLQPIFVQLDAGGAPFPKTSLDSSRDCREENPWWDYWDPTFGSIGWCSTPGFSIGGVPDEGVALCESKVTTIPYLVQSLQGSAIVRASTVVDPFDIEDGSGRQTLVGPMQYTIRDKKFQRVSVVPGDSERSQIIGNALGGIEGTGRWNYTGAYQCETVSDKQGFYYTAGEIYDLIGSGEGGLLRVDSVDSMGSIEDYTIISLGNGYSPEELVRVTNDSGLVVGGSPYWFASCAVFDYSTGLLDSRGTNYESRHGCLGINISRMSGMIEIDVNFLNDSTETPLILGQYGLPASIRMVNVVNYEQFTVGRLFWALNYNSSEKTTKSSSLIIFTVVSNDGVDIVLEIYKQFTGEYFTYETGTYVYSIQFVDYLEAMEVTVITNDRKQVVETRVTDTGRGHWDGDLIVVFQRYSDNNYIFRYESTIDEENIALPLVEGGGGYQFFQQSFVKFLDNRNACQVFEGITDTTQLIRLGSSSPCGNLYSLYWNINDGSDNFDYVNFLTMNATYGSIQTVVQQVNPLLVVNPLDSYVIIRNASFVLECNARIIVTTDGYSVGPTSVTGGSGVGMMLNINQIDTLGKPLDVSIIDYGTGYRPNDVITLNPGQTKLILKTKPTDNTKYFGTIISGASVTGIQGAALLFDTQIIQAGRGYVVGQYLTLCPNRDVGDTVVHIDTVGPDGEVLSITIISIDGCLQNLENVVTIIGGTEDCYFRLIKPEQPHPIKWHRRGTGYTTQIGVPTLNLQQNNLILSADLSGGECVPSNISPPLSSWNLDRYELGDQLAMVQGNNQTSIYQITTLNRASGVIEFTEVIQGVGYTIDNTNDAWVGCVNLSVVPTTVDIVADGNGHLVSVTLNTLGDRYIPGDDLLILDGDRNAVVRINPLRDVTPWWQEKINCRSPTSSEWNEYKNVLKSSRNLFDEQLVVDLKMNYPNYMNNSYYNNGDGGRDYVNNVGDSQCNIL